jgi:serine/threonine-protein phosphatase 2A regulatory subunit B'
MCFFENDYFLNILKTYKEMTFPMLVPVIVDLAENHWHKILQESLIALKTILKEIDPVAFDAAMEMKPDAKKEFAVKQTVEDRKAQDAKWNMLDTRLKNNRSDYKAPLMPFSREALICDYNPLYYKVYDKVKAVEI